LNLAGGIQSLQVSCSFSPVTELAPTVDAGVDGDGGDQGQKLIPPLELSTEFPSWLRELAVTANSLLSS